MFNCITCGFIVVDFRWLSLNVRWLQDSCTFKQFESIANLKGKLLTLNSLTFAKDVLKNSNLL